MPAKIPSNSTLLSVWPHLADPRVYVAGARHKMMTCLQKHGNAHVRIGVTGTGQKPCYRIFHKTEAGTEVVYGSFWDNHEPLENEDAVTNNWSTASMDFSEVDAFLKEQTSKKKS
jgi:hypothetical protein